MPRVLFSKPSYTPGISQPTEYEGEAVTPSDSADLPSGPCTAIYVTGAGNVNVQLAGGGTAVLTGLSADVRQTTVNQVVWYRVVSGPYASRDEAQAAQVTLQNSGIDALVVEQP